MLNPHIEGSTIHRSDAGLNYGVGFEYYLNQDATHTDNINGFVASKIALSDGWTIMPYFSTRYNYIPNDHITNPNSTELGFLLTSDDFRLGLSYYPTLLERSTSGYSANLQVRVFPDWFYRIAYSDQNNEQTFSTGISYQQPNTGFSVNYINTTNKIGANESKVEGRMEFRF